MLYATQVAGIKTLREKSEFVVWQWDGITWAGLGDHPSSQADVNPVASSAKATD